MCDFRWYDGVNVNQVTDQQSCEDHTQEEDKSYAA